MATWPVGERGPEVFLPKAEQVMRITDDTTPEQIAAMLDRMLAATQREQYVHRKSELLDELTPWDYRHAALDLLLEEYLQAKARV